MADPWNNATAYSPGALVSYNGRDYLRSQYPPTPTTGTPPNEEMGTDDKGVAIRTWTIYTPGYDAYGPTFNTTYFRIIQPTYSSDSEQPDFQYAGMTAYAENAYGTIGDPMAFVYGTTVEMDQAKANPAPTPDSPVCPADKCGVAMQQFAETGQIFIGADSTPDATNPRKYYIYVVFNHPLYFRRTITVLTRIQKTVTVYDSPDAPVVTYLDTYTLYVPDDRNYCSIFNLSGDYFVPANAAFEIIVPEDEFSSTGSTTYVFTSRGVVDATSND